MNYLSQCSIGLYSITTVLDTFLYVKVGFIIKPNLIFIHKKLVWVKSTLNNKQNVNIYL